MSRYVLPSLPIIRNRYFFIADALLLPAAAMFSFLLRLDIADLRPYAGTMLVFAALTVVKPAVFFLFGLYRRYWRYAGAGEIVSIVLATFAGTATATLAFWLVSPFLNVPPLPRSIPFLDWLVSLPLVGGTRLAVPVLSVVLRRLWRARRPVEMRPLDRRVLVVGAGDAGAMIVREMQANPGMGFVPVALVDDDRAKQGVSIHGVPVRGDRRDIPRLVASCRVDEVIIAMPTASGEAIRDVLAICRQASIPCKTIPGVYELIAGEVDLKQVRDVEITDLLRREPVRIGGAEAGRLLAGAVVLVTGAGGSIGAELCRQIAAYRPRQLLMLGHGENSIYHAWLELREKFPQLDARPLVADVRDKDRLTALLDRYRPEAIFHAAAHKHVPLMESNVAEAVMNNVFGTQSLLQAAEACGVARFALISTDKAVSPVSVMGATKRLAEWLVQDAARRTGRAYVVVRFGNVLGSRGSVVPLFQRQIASGGPVTITHPEVRRFFMTIPEAVQLVIQAMVLGRGGEIFVLDMGEQVRVVDLAADLIRLSGLEPNRDVEIVFTGLRPGEKLCEALFESDEQPQPTRHEKIFVASGNTLWASEVLFRHLQELWAAVKEGNEARIRAKLQEIVPRYTPSVETWFDPDLGEQE